MAVLLKNGIPAPAVTAMVLVVFTVFVMVPEVSAVRYIVGGNQGWTSSGTVNYTTWPLDKHFYPDDWLYFVYDRNQVDVIEVNKTNYETCNAVHPVHNWTTGAGRDVVPLNYTRHFYFISSRGQCYGGMKLAVLVEHHPPPPSSSPVKNDASTFRTFRGQIIIPAILAIGLFWDSFIRIW